MTRSLRRILVLSAAAAAAPAVSAAEPGGGPAPPLPPRAHQLDDSYTFEQYLTHFEKSYGDPEEYERCSETFARNMEKILRHNEGRMDASGGVLEGYVMGVNQFTDVEVRDLPLGYNKAHHPAWRVQLARAGVVTSTERLLTEAVTSSYAKPPDFDTEDVTSLPPSVDWTAEGKVNPIVPQQGNCGSCWAFAATAAAESHLALATGEGPPSLSEQDMLECAPNPDHCGGAGGCSGSTVELGLNYVADKTARGEGGMYDIADVPYDANNTDWECEDVAKGKSPVVGIEGWTQLPANNYEAVMNAVAKVGPVAIAVAASSWALYERGVFDSRDAEMNHAVLLVGYGVDGDTGEKYWKVRNSWGGGFGEDGYIRIKRTDGDGDACEMDDKPLVGMACALDDNGNKLDVEPVEVCGTCGILLDASYPVGVRRLP